GVVVHLFPARDERVRLLELGGGQDVLQTPLVEVPAEEAIEVEEHGVGVERLAVVKGHAPTERELPGQLTHGLPRERQVRRSAPNSRARQIVFGSSRRVALNYITGLRSCQRCGPCGSSAVKRSAQSCWRGRS